MQNQLQLHIYYKLSARSSLNSNTKRERQRALEAPEDSHAASTVYLVDSFIFLNGTQDSSDCVQHGVPHDSTRGRGEGSRREDGGFGGKEALRRAAMQDVRGHPGRGPLPGGHPAACLVLARFKGRNGLSSFHLHHCVFFFAKTEHF